MSLIIAVLCALIYVINCDDNYVGLIEFTSKLIARPKDIVTCVRYVTNVEEDEEMTKDRTINNLIEKALLNVVLPINVVSNDRVLTRQDKLRNICNIHVLICQDFRECLRKYFANYNELFKPFSKIFIVTSETNKSSLNEAKRLISTYAYDILVVRIRLGVEEVTRNALQLTKFCNTNSSFNVQVKSIVMGKILARWHDGSGTFLREAFDMRKWQPRFDNEQSMIASTANCPPFVYCNSSQPYEGVDYRIFKEITKNWHTNVTCVPKREDSYGTIVEKVKNKTSDVGFCSLWSTMIKFEGIELTKPYGMLCASFLVPKPHLLPEATFVFQPFDATLWLLCFVVLLVASTIFYATDRICFALIKKQIFASYNKTFLELLRIMTMGSINLSPQWESLRLLVMVWWFFTILLSTAYSAGITSALTFPRYTRPINTLSDMVKSDVKWGTSVISMANYYKSSADQILQAIGDNWLLEQTNTEKLERIKRNNYGTFVKLLPARYVTDTDMFDDYAKNNLKTLNDCLGEYQVTFVLQKTTHYGKLFNNGIQSLLENGIIDHWYGIIRHAYGLRYLENFFYVRLQTKHVPLKLDRLMGIFYLYVTGMITATILFTFEQISHK